MDRTAPDLDALRDELAHAVERGVQSRVSELLEAGAPLGATVRAAKRTKNAPLVALLEAEKTARAPARKLLQALAREYLVPAAGPTNEDPESSRFGGMPWLPVDAPWPRCEGCGGALAFVVQLNLSCDLSAHSASAFGLYELRPRPKGHTLLQLFLCSAAHPAGVAPGYLARCVDAAGRAEREPPAGVELRPCVSFTKRIGAGGVEVPEEELGAAETHRFGLEVSFARALADAGLEHARGRGEKLGGWPAWLAGPAYPQCAHDGALMDKLFVQLAPGGLAPDVYGDGGTTYVLQCPEDPTHFGLVRQHPGQQPVPWSAPPPEEDAERCPEAPLRKPRR